MPHGGSPFLLIAKDWIWDSLDGVLAAAYETGKVTNCPGLPGTEGLPGMGGFLYKASKDPGRPGPVGLPRNSRELEASYLPTHTPTWFPVSMVEANRAVDRKGLGRRSCWGHWPHSWDSRCVHATPEHGPSCSVSILCMGSGLWARKPKTPRWRLPFSEEYSSCFLPGNSGRQLMLRGCGVK